MRLVWGGPGNRGPERGLGSGHPLTRKWASCKATWRKLFEERRQRLMKLLPKWEKGKTWQSMSPDKALAVRRAREMERWICPRRSGEERRGEHGWGDRWGDRWGWG